MSLKDGEKGEVLVWPFSKGGLIRVTVMLRFPGKGPNELKSLESWSRGHHFYSMFACHTFGDKCTCYSKVNLGDVDTGHIMSANSVKAPMDPFFFQLILSGEDEKYSKIKNEIVSRFSPRMWNAFDEASELLNYTSAVWCVDRGGPPDTCDPYVFFNNDKLDACLDGLVNLCEVAHYDFVIITDRNQLHDRLLCYSTNIQ